MTPTVEKPAVIRQKTCPSATLSIANPTWAFKKQQHDRGSVNLIVPSDYAKVLPVIRSIRPASPQFMLRNTFTAFRCSS